MEPTQDPQKVDAEEDGWMDPLTELESSMKPTQNKGKARKNVYISDDPFETDFDAGQEHPDVERKVDTDAIAYTPPEDEWSGRNTNEQWRWDDLHNPTPAVLAREPRSAQDFRGLLTTSPKSSIFQDHEESLKYTTTAWDLYGRLDDSSREEVKVEFLQWLSRHHNETAGTHCLELFHSIPVPERTMDVYKSAFKAFMRSHLFGLAEQEHAEALDRLNHAHELSIWLCQMAVHNGMWDFAVRVKMQLYAKHDDTARAWVDNIFWREISAKQSNLLSKAVRLSKHYRMLLQADSVSEEFQEFSMKIFKIAIINEFTAASPRRCLTMATAKKTLKDGQIRYLVGRIQHTSSNPPAFFHEVLTALIESTSKIQYNDAHKTVSYMYRQYRAMSGVVPSEALLLRMLQRLLRYAESVARVSESPSTLSIGLIRDDWITFHQKLDIEAYHSIMRYYSRIGDPVAVQAYYGLLCEDYPRYEDQENVLWTLVSVYGQRGEIQSAQSEFEKIHAVAADAGKCPNLWTWNALLHAHSRAGDVEGALASMQRLIDSGQKPDFYSFHPLCEVYAARGDVDSVEDLIEQYEEMTGCTRNTDLYRSVMTAHSKAQDIASVRSTLGEVIAKVNANEIEGSLTGCFNVLLTSLALTRRRVEFERTYRWMRARYPPDVFTYAARMQNLVGRRKTSAALQFINGAMPNLGLQPQAFHYAIVMQGYVRQRFNKRALQVHALMLQRNIRPTFNTDVLYAKASALFETKRVWGMGKVAVDYPVDKLIDAMQEIFRDPAAGYAAKEPRMKSAAVQQSPQAFLFSNLIEVYGARDLLGGVQVLLQRFTEAANMGSEPPLGSMPIQILTALMPAYIRAHRWGDVESCWKLAKEQADAVVSRKVEPHLKPQAPGDEKAVDIMKLSVADTTLSEQVSDPGDSGEVINRQKVQRQKNRQYRLRSSEKRNATWKDPGLRLMLIEPLKHYIKALASQSRISEIISTVASALKQGYVLDRTTWNVFIEALIGTDPPLALLAFRLTEKYLIHDFPGWQKRRHRVLRSDEVLGIQHMRGRRHLDPSWLSPRYRTLVKLGGALLEIRRRDLLGLNSTPDDPSLARHVGTAKQIRQLAPKTAYVVQTIPRIRRDELQKKYLRREL